MLRLLALNAYNTWQQLEEKLLLSKIHRMPLEIPFAEMTGAAAENENICEVCETGEVESKPLLLALNDQALM